MAKIKIMATVIAMVILLVLQAIGPAYAGLGIDGAIINSQVESGTHNTFEMTVKSNMDDKPMDLVVDVLGMGQTSYGINTELDANHDNNPYSARPFLNITPAQFRLEPGGVQKVVVDANIPEDVGAGGRYAMIKVHTKPSKNGLLGVALAINVPVLLVNADQDVNETAAIANLSLQHPISPKQQNVSLYLQNTGDCHYKAMVSAELKDNAGSILANTTTPLSFSSILPSYSRWFNFTLVPSSELKPGNYSIDTLVIAGDETELGNKSITFDITP